MFSPWMFQGQSSEEEQSGFAGHFQPDSQPALVVPQ